MTAARPRRPAAAARAIAVGAAAAAVALAGSAVVARGDRAPPDAAAGARAFVDVARVLQSPRCQNCHPAGDRPLQTDAGIPHRFQISRRSVDAGLPCGACHQERNSEALGIPGGPPGAPHWGLPPAATPMIFEGRTPRALCLQLRDEAQTGGRDLGELLEHVRTDALVLWGFRPGGQRTRPPLSHDAFVTAFRTWVEAGGPCPADPAPGASAGAR
jgi:hypothetical protein